MVAHGCSTVVDMPLPPNDKTPDSKLLAVSIIIGLILHGCLNRGF